MNAVITRLVSGFFIGLVCCGQSIYISMGKVKKTAGRPRKKKKTGGPMGRPIALTPELADIICNLVAAGNYLTTAFKLAGVPERTGFKWVEYGHNFDGSKPHHIVFVEFLQSINKAKAAAEVGALERVAEANAWQSTAWFLERRYPERWSIRQRIDQVAQQQTADTIDRLLEAVSDDAKKEIISVLLAEEKSVREESLESSKGDGDSEFSFNRE